MLLQKHSPAIESLRQILTGLGWDRIYREKKTNTTEAQVGKKNICIELFTWLEETHVFIKFSWNFELKEWGKDLIGAIVFSRKQRFWVDSNEKHSGVVNL